MYKEKKLHYAGQSQCMVSDQQVNWRTKIKKAKKFPDKQATAKMFKLSNWLTLSLVLEEEEVA